MYWATFWAIFFTNSSGHPVTDKRARCPIETRQDVHAVHHPVVANEIENPFFISLAMPQRLTFRRGTNAKVVSPLLSDCYSIGPVDHFFTFRQFEPTNSASTAKRVGGRCDLAPRGGSIRRSPSATLLQGWILSIRAAANLIPRVCKIFRVFADS
jgi:hypothetical protein